MNWDDLSETERNELLIERGALLSAMVDSISDVRSRNDDITSAAVLLADQSDRRRV
jgi:hypothetical protein